MYIYIYIYIYACIAKRKKATNDILQRAMWAFSK